MKYLIIPLILIFWNIENGRAQSYFQEEYLNVWQRATAYSLEVADKMPDSLYDYRPSAESMSFKEQQLHMVGNISFLTRYITGKNRNFYQSALADTLQKKEVMEIMTAAFLYVNQHIINSDSATLSETVNFKGAEMSKENTFYLIRNHLTHHRAQCVLYLRMNAIDPPQYVGW